MLLKNKEKFFLPFHFGVKKGGNVPYSSDSNGFNFFNVP